MLTTRFRATVGQKPTRYSGGQQQPWSSQRHVQHADQHGTRKTAILAMANRIICVKIASASLASAPTTISFLPSDVRRLRTCCASASPYVGFAARGRQPDVAVALHGGMLCQLPRSFTSAAPRPSSQSMDVQTRGRSGRNVELCAEEGQQATDLVSHGRHHTSDYCVLYGPAQPREC